MPQASFRATDGDLHIGDSTSGSDTTSPRALGALQTSSDTRLRNEAGSQVCHAGAGKHRKTLTVVFIEW